MSRTAEGYGKAADMEMKKQSELDLRKQLMEAETEKQLRIDEIRRGRDVSDRLTEETRVQTPEYLANQAKAEAGRFDALIAAGVPAAEARALVAKGVAAAGVEKTLAPVKAEAAKVTYDAGKTLDAQKAADGVIAKIKETKTLSDSPDYLEGTAKLSEAANADKIKAAQIRADSVSGKSSGDGTAKVRSTYTNSAGNKVAVMSNGSEKVLGKAADYDRSVAKIILDMGKNDIRFSKLPPAEQRKKAEEVLRGQMNAPSSGKDLTGLNDPKYLRKRDAAAD